MITESVLRFLRLQAEQDAKRPYAGISASNISRCDRALWHAGNGDRAEAAPITRQWSFMRGRFAEGEIAELVNASGITILDPHPVVRWAGRNHHPDKLIHIEMSPGGGLEKHFLEIKRLSPEFFNSIRTKGLREGASGYYSQCQTYCAAEPGFAPVVFLAITEPFDIYEEIIHTDPDWQSYMESEFARKGEIRGELEPPSPPYPSDSSECGDCPYFRTACWGVIFSQLRDEEVSLPIEAAPPLVNVVALQILRREADVSYSEARAAIEKLHVETGARKINFPGFSSTVSTSVRRTPDVDLLRESLSPETFGRVMKSRQVSQVRVTVKDGR